MAGQQPPVGRRHSGRRGDFARLDKEDGLLRRQAGRYGPVLRALKRDRAEAHGDAGLALPLSGTGRQGDLMLPLGPVGQAVEKSARPLRNRPVLRGPDRHFHAFGPVGEHLVNVALTVGDRRHPRRARRRQTPAGPQAVEPALALLAANSAALRAFAAAAMTLDDPGIHKARQRALLALNRNRGRPDKAVTQAVVAETRRVLDRQNIQTRNPRRRPRRRPVHNLLHRHLVMAQKPPDPHLARPAAPRTPRRKTPRTLPHKAIVQKPIRPVHPPVPEKRRGPDHPSTPLANPQTPSNARNQNHPQSANPHSNTDQVPDVCMR